MNERVYDEKYTKSDLNNFIRNIIILNKNKIIQIPKNIINVLKSFYPNKFTKTKYLYEMQTRKNKINDKYLLSICDILHHSYFAEYYVDNIKNKKIYQINKKFIKTNIY